MAPKKRKSTSKLVAEPVGPVVSQEQHEAELKSLAAKAKEETWDKHIKEQASIYSQAIVILTLIALSANASLYNLSPVYGGIPAAINHQYVIWAACFLGWASNIYLRRYLSFSPAKLLPIIATSMPMVQFYLFKLSATLTAYWGPTITEALTLFPLMTVGVSCVATLLEGADLSYLPRSLRGGTPGLGAYVFLRTVGMVSNDYLVANMGRTFFHTRIGLQALLAGAYTIFAPSKLMMFAVPGLLHTALLNTHVSSPVALVSRNTTMSFDGWNVLDRKESITGYISILESQKIGIRAMRCDHSLLGGEWIHYKTEPVAESIYGVFAMLEGVRLIERPVKIQDKEAKALIVGMGIGTAPAALVAHGIDTTVVEIDPVVVEFAEKYFHVPENYTSVVQDAVTYTAALAKDPAGQRFDYILHDVFTGGAEPIPLFTLEFLQGLNTLLKPNGVVAINYAGDFLRTPIKAVVYTIRQVFPTCRIFREDPREEGESKRLEDGQDFTNIVIFCTKQSEKLVFRDATKADLLGSRTRELFLPPEHEVFDADFTSQEKPRLVTNEDNEQLARYQDGTALGHWKVMRKVLAARMWEDW